MADGIEAFRAQLSPNFAGNLRKAHSKLAKLPGAGMAWHRNWRLVQANYERLWLFPRRPLALLCGYLPTHRWLLAPRLALPLRARLRAWRRGAQRPKQIAPAVMTAGAMR
jgi:hypothetical protein